MQRRSRRSRAMVFGPTMEGPVNVRQEHLQEWHGEDPLLQMLPKRERLYALACRTMKPDLSNEETIALSDLLKRSIEADRYPLSPRVQMWKRVLAKLEPEPVAAANPYPAPSRYEPLRAALTKKRRARH
jgi:hypothetical protein